MSRVRVEFYGLARLRAGRAELVVGAATVRDALAAAQAACPGLIVLRDTGLSPEFLVSVGGTRFTTDLDQPLADGDSLLILGADAGG
jgi:molybdopterin converting factor small subunit